ncbi:MAG: GSCFA domain-containing protein [Cytophagaceae bacterium]|nr:GSCFA domain-containing protein [Cytophagaceae bacterium]
MKLQTSILLETSRVQIDYGSRVLMLGSCFVENMGAKLKEHKFQVEVNPFGILFPPLAISRFVDLVVKNYSFAQDDLWLVNGRYHCPHAHSDFSDGDAEKVVGNLNTAIENTASYLKNTTHVILTLGTAWGYRYKESGEIVANCHKVPQANFDKELASVDEIKLALKTTIENLKILNPGLEVVITVSPVRHIKDGFVENQRSKAHLIAAVHELMEQEVVATYFPAYEIMMDELRDYRFYDRDLVHPNALAIDYIWEKFIEVHLSAKAKKILPEVVSILRDMQHRPFDTESEGHKKFQRKLEEKKAKLSQVLPHISF